MLLSDLSALRLGLLACAAMAGGISLPAAAQSAPERGVFVTQIGESQRATIIQRHADSVAQVRQDGADNETSLRQDGSAPHFAQIAQDGDDNTAAVQQDGDGSTDLALAQIGNSNTALVSQREDSPGAQTTATVLQRGNDNSIALAQDGSDNQAQLSQEGDNNVMTASQIESGNRLEWSQIGNGLSDLQIVQQGGSTMQVTQSNVGAAYAPPQASGG